MSLINLFKYFFTIFLLALPRIYVSSEESEIPEVRVLILESESEITVDIKSSLIIKRYSDKKDLAKYTEINDLNIIPKDDGIKIGRFFTKEDKIYVIPTISSHPISINNNKHIGYISVIKTNKDKLNVILHTNMETYIEGVIGSEIGDNVDEEAMKAQAVSARTYAIARTNAEKKSKKNIYFDLFSDTRSQVYSGLKKVNSRIKNAVDDTFGMVLTYDGDIFTTFYHSTCGGSTLPVNEVFSDVKNIEPLSGVKCDFCDDSQFFNWKYKISSNDLISKLEKNFSEKIFLIQNINCKVDKVTEKVNEVVFKVKTKSEIKNLEMTGAKLRDILGDDKLRSTRFKVEKIDDSYLFTGRGWGHFVGMCQSGTIKLARNKKKFDEILSFYYPGSKLFVLYHKKKKI